MNVVVAALSVALTWPLLVAFPINGGDATWVAQSSRALVQCARDRVWSSCPNTYQFGWLQHIPGILLAWKGLDDNSIMTFLTLINAFAFAWLIIRVARLTWVARHTRALMGLLTLAGPLYAFSVYSFSEILTTVLLVALVLALIERRAGWHVWLLTFLLASSRETAFLMVAPIAAAILIVSGATIRIELRRWMNLASACFAGLVAVLWFNVWKYGSVSNDHYTDPIRRVPGTVLKVKNFLAIWISPSGGVLPFWLLGGLVAIVIPLMLLARWRTQRRCAAAAALLLLALGLQTGLLSAWYAPFGWVTWGPRLILPTVAGVAFATVLLFPGVVNEAIIRIKFRLVALGILFVGLVGSGLANLGFVLNRSATLQWFTPPLPPWCPVTANVEIDRNYYFSCALDFAPWQLGRTIWDSGIHQVTQGWGLIFAGLVALLLGVVVAAPYDTLSATTTRPPEIAEMRERSRSNG